MYSNGHTFIDKLYHLEFKIIKVFEEYKMFLCETTDPTKDPHGMDIRLYCYFSSDYIHDCSDYK